MKTQLLNLRIKHKPPVKIHIGYNCIFENLKTCNLQNKTIFIITQKNLLDQYTTPIQEFLTQQFNASCHIICCANGEQAKSIASYESCMDKIFDIGVERHDVIIGIGGGVITDLAGFIASSCLRGLTLIQIPTTLLAQVDAAIGGKTGINHKTGKNLIGSFYQPQHIIIDLITLKTLAFDEFKSGFGEVLKYAFICDETLFTFLNTHASKLKSFDITKHLDLFNTVITRSCQNKIDVVQADEQESNLRAILNFGHTIGHAIEAMFNYNTYKHGFCVVFGMCAATYIAQKKGLISESYATEIYELIKLYDYHQISLAKLNKPDLIQLLKRDKKVKQKVIRFILSTGKSKVEIFDDVSINEIYDSIDFIEDFFKGDS